MEHHIGEILIEFALKVGCTPKILKEKNWEYKIDDRWELKCNGTENKRDNLEPYSWYLYYNGWPAGILAITGEGVIAAGEGANEDTFRKAIEEKAKSL